MAQRPEVDDRPLKVVISGAFSTGKTTLAAALTRQLGLEGRTVSDIGDVARDSPLPLHRDQTPHASAWLIGTQIARESEVSRQDVDLILCDRAVFDVLSHTLLIQPSSPAEEQLIARVWALGRAWADTYDLVLATAIDEGLPPTADGLRVADSSYRRLLDDSLHTTFKRLDIEPIILPTVPAKTVDTALRRIRGMFP